MVGLGAHHYRDPVSFWRISDSSTPIGSSSYGRSRSIGLGVYVLRKPAEPARPAVDDIPSPLPAVDDIPSPLPAPDSEESDAYDPPEEAFDDETPRRRAELERLTDA